jgi:hypothetical protein
MVSMASTKRRKPSMTAEHKAALAVGRTEGRAVRNYLDALEAHKPKRGRKRTPDSIQKRMKAIDQALAGADKLTELKLIQERMNLDVEMASLDASENLSELEEAFVNVAQSYSERQGITYAAWREVGVPASVLKRSGISRSS